jgi:hypothetical protein
VYPRVEDDAHAGFIRFLVEQSGLGVTERMLQTAGTVEALETLLQLRPRCNITTDLLTQHHRTRAEIMCLFQSQVDLRATEDIVLCALRASRWEYPGSPSASPPRRDVLEAMWEHSPYLPVMPTLLSTVTSLSELEFLVTRRNRCWVLTTLLAAKIMPKEEGPAMMRVLLERSPCFLVTPNRFFLAKPYHRLEMPEVFLNHNPTMEMTESMMICVLDGLRTHEDLGRLVSILLMYERPLEVTSTVTKAIQKLKVRAAAVQEGSDAAETPNSHGESNEDLLELWDTNT